MSLHGDHEHGAAWRRRQRRLRMHWRHEQLTLQMLLATYEHHAAPRGQSRARSGGWERAVLHGQVPEHPTPQVAGTEYSTLDVEDVPATGSRPDRLAGVRPQERVQQHFVDQFVDAASALPILDVPVPLMGEQVVVVLHFFDALIPVAEQVIEVPKIIIERIPPRTLVRDTQLLVEVPTIVSYSLLQLIMEQNVDIPVPGGGGRLAGLQGSLPGQGSTAPSVVQIVDIPGGGPRGSRPRQGSLASSSFHSPAGSDDDADEPGTGVFRTFPRLKKSAKVTLHSSPTVLRSVSSSELSAHRVPRTGPSAHSRPSDERTSFVDAHGHAWVRLDTLNGSYWRNLDLQHSQWHPPWEE